MSQCKLFLIHSFPKSQEAWGDFPGIALGVIVRSSAGWGGGEGREYEACHRGVTVEGE